MSNKIQTQSANWRTKIKNKLFSTRKMKVFSAIVFLAVGGTVFFSINYFAKGATYGWLQATWNGGADTNAVANHTSNQSGWTKFFSKDTNISIDNDELSLSSASANIIETSDADFNAGTSGSGWEVKVSGDGVHLLRCGIDSITYAGVVYPTALIGTQCWLAKNLNVGTIISSSGNQTNNSILEKYCYSNNEANCTTYGGLYQWDEAMQYTETAGVQGICPVGWHIPTDAEFYVLENYLKDVGQTCDANRAQNTYDCPTAGTKLKSGGSSGFNTPLAGIYVGSPLYFIGISEYEQMWSSSISGSNAFCRVLCSTSEFVNCSAVNRAAYVQTRGKTIRCLKN